MPVPCVRVRLDAGEATRAALAADDLLDHDHQIVQENGYLYIPVTEPAVAEASYEVVRKEVPTRIGQSMPADLLDWVPSYERLGDVVLVDEDDPQRATEVATAIMDSELPVKTVLNRQSKIKGEERVRDWEILAGDGTETVHREYGYEYALDIAAVYFSPRLATERHRVVTQVSAGERAVDMFAGVGPFAIPMADHGATVVAVDVNETAVEYLRSNAHRNGVAESVTAIHGDVRDVARPYRDSGDRIVMNLPHRAQEFLETAVLIAGGECVLHYYDIQSDEDPFGPGEAAIRRVAGGEYDVTVLNRREVRSYAPHELNVVLDVELTAR